MAAETEAIQEEIRRRVESKVGNIPHIESKYDKTSWLFKVTPTSPLINGSAQFRIYNFPGCCKYAVLSQMQTNGAYRGIGLAKLMLELAEWVGVYDYEVSTLVGTAAEGKNDEMAQLAKKFGWKEIHGGHNPNSGNWVRMFIKELPEIDREVDEPDYDEEW